MDGSRHIKNPDGDSTAAREAARLFETRSRAFATTHWGTVLAVGQGNAAQSAEALEILCRKYWHPLYAFIRRRGFGVHEAEDLTQAFFAHLLDSEAFNKADRSKGKFRTFLLAALQHFLANEWDKARAQKRGGRLKIISLDELAAEEIYHCEPVESSTPEKLYEQRWAMRTVAMVHEVLREEYAAAGKAALFAKLESGLTGNTDPHWLAEIAVELGMKDGALRVALHRLRRRFGELLRKEIAQTVHSEDDVEEEIRHLFSAFAD